MTTKSPPPLPEVPTRVAYAEWDDHRFYGKGVCADLLGRVGFTDVLAMAACGRALPPDAVGVVDDWGVVSTAADPRIWPLKVARIVSAYGGMLPAFGASFVYFGDAMVGPWTMKPAAAGLLDIARALGPRADDDAAVEAEVARRVAARVRWHGWGVPYREHDERLTAFRACVARRGRTALPYWRLFERVGAALRRRRRLEPNIGGGGAAALLDAGLLPDEIAALCTALVAPNFLANAREGAEQALPLLRRLPDERVRYVGAPPRVSPRAAAAAASERRAGG